MKRILIAAVATMWILSSTVCRAAEVRPQMSREEKIAAGCTFGPGGTDFTLGGGDCTVNKDTKTQGRGESTTTTTTDTTQTTDKPSTPGGTVEVTVPTESTSKKPGTSSSGSGNVDPPKITTSKELADETNSAVINALHKSLYGFYNTEYDSFSDNYEDYINKFQRVIDEVDANGNKIDAEWRKNMIAQITNTDFSVIDPSKVKYDKENDSYYVDIKVAGAEVHYELEPDEEGFHVTNSWSTVKSERKVKEWLAEEKVSAELAYTVWRWKNTTNEGWINHYGSDFIYVNGNKAGSTTAKKAYLQVHLGNGEYDDGTWKIEGKQYFTEHWRQGYHYYTEEHKTVKEHDAQGNVTGTHTKTIRHPSSGYYTDYRYWDIEDVLYYTKYYDATVPLVCTGCPTITVCVGEGPCDCEAPYTKCDDTKDDAVETDTYVQLTN